MKITDEAVEAAVDKWRDHEFDGLRDFRRMRAALEAAIPHMVPVVEASDGKYADVLVPFLHLMEAELHANTGKGDRPGWLAMDRKTGLLEIFYHLAKMQKAVKDDDQPGIREYGADVANMAMMLVDICGALPDLASRPSNTSPVVSHEGAEGDAQEPQDTLPGPNANYTSELKAAAFSLFSGSPTPQPELEVFYWNARGMLGPSPELGDKSIGWVRLSDHLSIASELRAALEEQNSEAWSSWDLCEKNRLASLEQENARNIATIRAVRAEFHTEKMDDGRNAGVGYGSDALPRVIDLLDTALKESRS